MASGPRTGSPHIYDKTAKKYKKTVIVSIALRPFPEVELAKKSGTTPRAASRNGTVKSLRLVGMIVGIVRFSDRRPKIGNYR